MSAEGFRKKRRRVATDMDARPSPLVDLLERLSLGTQYLLSSSQSSESRESESAPESQSQPESLRPGATPSSERVSLGRPHALAAPSSVVRMQPSFALGVGLEEGPVVLGEGRRGRS